MFPVIPSNYLCAVALLCAPAEKPVPEKLISCFEQAKPFLQQVAISWEVMDTREPRYLLCQKNNYVSDLEMLRRRVQRLNEAPCVFDCMRFPPRKVVDEWLKMNRKYKKQLQERCKIDVTHESWYSDAIKETDFLYDLWSNVKDTRCEHYYVTYRRGALKKVREMVGYPAFYNGDFPPPVPTWRFRRID